MHILGRRTLSIDDVLFESIDANTTTYMVDNVIKLFRELHNNPQWVKSIKNEVLVDWFEELDLSDDTTYTNPNFIEEIKQRVIELRQTHKLQSHDVDAALMTCHNEFMSTLSKIIHEVKRVRHLPYPAVSRPFKELLGPNWMHTIQAMMHNPVSFMNDTFDLELARKAYDYTPKKQRINIVNVIKDAIDEILEITKVHDAKLRSKIRPEGPKNGPFEEFAFAEERYGHVPLEPDTDEEKRLFNVLQMHFEQNEPMSVRDAEKFKKILAKKQYSTIFHAPEQQYIYRGMSVHEEWMKIALNLKEDVPDDGEREAQFTFTPLTVRGATSWTIDADIAKNFSKQNSNRERRYQVTLIASVKDNPNRLMVGPGGLYTINDMSLHGLEHEVIALGDIKVSKITWSSYARVEDYPLSDEEKSFYDMSF